MEGRRRKCGRRDRGTTTLILSFFGRGHLLLLAAATVVNRSLEESLQSLKRRSKAEAAERNSTQQPPTIRVSGKERPAKAQPTGKRQRQTGWQFPRTLYTYKHLAKLKVESAMQTYRELPSFQRKGQLGCFTTQSTKIERENEESRRRGFLHATMPFSPSLLSRPIIGWE